MKTHITTPVTPNQTDDVETPNLSAILADLRHRARNLTAATSAAATKYWQVTDELDDLISRIASLTVQQAEANEQYQQAADEQADAEHEVQQLEEYIDDLHAMIKCRGGETGEGKKTKRRRKKFDRLAACQHRENGLASLSDATHVTLVIKARRKARRDRECDKSVNQIRRARLRAQEERGLNPAEILSIPTKRRDREAYFAELEESRRVATIAACTCPHLVAANLNGECQHA